MFDQYEWEGWTFEGLSSSGDLAFKDGRRMEAHRVILAGHWAGCSAAEIKKISLAFRLMNFN